MSEWKSEDAVRRAQRAEALLRDEVLMGSLTQLESDYIAHWRLTKHDDQMGREKLWLAVQVVGKIRDHLRNVMNNGKLAQRELDELAARKKAGIFSR